MEAGEKDDAAAAPADSHDRPSPLDALVEDLRRLRLEAGDVAYAEIASRIAARREAEGVDPRAARIARSTVFDAFQTGRRRMNPALVKEIVLALGHDEDEAERWRRRYLDVRREPAEAEPAPSHPGAGTAIQGAGLLLGALIACVALNLYLGTLIIRHEIPLYLDMIGTAAASFAFGPWYGVMVALATNTLGALVSTPETIVFAIVNATGAILWGYGIRRYAHSVPRLLLLNVVVALACSLEGAPLNVLMYDGPSDHAGPTMSAIAHAYENIWSATFAVNVSVSIIDKMIAGCLGLVLARLLIRWRLGRGDSAALPVLLRHRTAEE
ncbi:hypothetical protein ACYX8G_11800 [Microbacterium saperdae]